MGNEMSEENIKTFFDTLSELAAKQYNVQIRYTVTRKKDCEVLHKGSAKNECTF